MLRKSLVAAIRLGVIVCPLSASGQVLPTVTFSASPTSIPSGLSSTLSWSSANATACSGTGKGFSPSGPSGSIDVSPKTTTTYGITCTGAGGSASQSATVAVTAAPTVTVGQTVATTGTTWVYSTPTPNTPAIGHEWPGNQGVVIGGPASNGFTWWGVAFNDGLTGWTYQSGIAAVSPTAPPVSFSANPRASPPASRRRFHGRRPTRLPAPELASLHRASRGLSPSCRPQPPFTASPAQGVADLQLNRRKWS